MIRQETVMERIAQHREVLQPFGVRHLWLFGSVVREEGQVNDVDLLVEFERPPSLVGFIQLQHTLEEILQAPVDLVSKGGCSARFLQAIEKELRDVA